MLRQAGSSTIGMLKQLLLLLGLLAVVESAGKQYAYAYTTNTDFQCKDAKKLFPVLMRYLSDYSFHKVSTLFPVMVILMGSITCTSFRKLKLL